MHKLLLNMYLTVFITLLAISTARGNYGYGQQTSGQVCDQNAYNRARETIRLEIQQRNSRLQPPYDSQYSRSGIPPLTNGYQPSSNTGNGQMMNQLNDHQCKVLREAFDDVLINTPLCESVGSIPFHNTADLIRQARTFLAQYCEQNQGWVYSHCYKRREIADCENAYSQMRQLSMPNHLKANQFGNFNNHLNSQPVQSMSVRLEQCQAFIHFRNCVLNNTKSGCYQLDLSYLGTYLVDKAQDSVWSCTQNYSIINPIDQYSRRTDLMYPNQNRPALYSQFPSSYNNPNDPNNQFGSYNGLNSLPTHHLGANQPLSSDTGNIDRLGGALAGVYAGSIDICIKRVKPFENQCIDQLIQRQREARYGRSSNDVERRICCALFYFRDCLSRIVLERCVGSTKMAVDILMGDRNREITTTCRDVTRDQCNGVTSLMPSNTALLIPIILSTMFISIFRSL